MSDVLDVIKSRRSVRVFKEGAPKDVLDKILDAGRWAPSGMNTQPWVFIVVDDTDKKKKLRESYDRIRKSWGAYEQDSSFLEKATLVLACMEVEKLTPVVSVSLAAENMLVAAKALGYDSLVMTTHMISDESKKSISDLFKLPKNIQPHSLLAFGVGGETPEPKERKADEKTFHKNEYGSEYKLG